VPLRGIFTDENGVRRVEVCAPQKIFQSVEGDRPIPPRALHQGNASGVFAGLTPRKRCRPVVGSLGHEPTRVADGAVNVSDAFALRSIGFGGFTFSLRRDLFRDREAALRTRRGTVGDSVVALRAIDEHAGD
jgi:hypothetical protein